MSCKTVVCTSVKQSHRLYDILGVFWAEYAWKLPCPLFPGRVGEVAEDRSGEAANGAGQW